MNNIINLHSEQFTDDFECKCGNTSNLDGFYPCDELGKEIEPDDKWNLLYKCSRCKQIYKNENV